MLEVGIAYRALGARVAMNAAHLVVVGRWLDPYAAAAHSGGPRAGATLAASCGHTT